MTDSTPDEQTLLPCPFCGGEAEHNEGKHGDGTRWNYLACSDCEAMQPFVSSAEMSAHDESWNLAKNAEAWNRRAAMPDTNALEAADTLISIVDGIGGLSHGTWRDEKGVRLKDTPEWVSFYVAARGGKA